MKAVLQCRLWKKDTGACLKLLLVSVIVTCLAVHRHAWAKYLPYRWNASSRSPMHLLYFMSLVSESLWKRLFKYIENFTSKKTENFQIKSSDIFHIFAQNIDCGYSLEPPRWGGSNEYPQSMVLSRNKENNLYPCKLQFYYIKVGFKGVKII